MFVKWENKRLCLLNQKILFQEKVDVVEWDTYLSLKFEIENLKG